MRRSSEAHSGFAQIAFSASEVARWQLKDGPSARDAATDGAQVISNKAEAAPRALYAGMEDMSIIRKSWNRQAGWTSD